MMIVGLFLQKKRMGFLSSSFSNIYSSVARLNKILFDSALKMSICPGPYDKKVGTLVLKVLLDLIINIFNII